MKRDGENWDRNVVLSMVSKNCEGNLLLWSATVVAIWCRRWNAHTYGTWHTLNAEREIQILCRAEKAKL